MAFASGSLLQIRYVPEATPGTTPVAPDVASHNALRVTGSSLKYDLKSETSKEIRADRATTDLALVSASASGGLNFELSYGEFDPFLEAALQGTWTADVLKHGSSMRYFSVEEGFSDVNQFRVFRGMALNKLSLSFETGAILGGSLDFIGMNAAVGGATFMPGTTTASKTGGVMNSVVGVGNIKEGGAALSGVAIKSLKLDVDNSLRGQEAIGTLGFVGIGSGTIQVTGSVEAYFSNATLYNKFLNNTATSLSWEAADTAGNKYLFELPHVKFSAGDITGGSLNSDIMVSLSYTALLDSVSGTMIKVTRTPSP